MTLLWQTTRIGLDGSALQASMAGTTGQLAALENTISTAAAGSDDGDASGEYRLRVVSEAGEPLGVLLGIDDTAQFFTALSRTDYVFHIDPSGQVGIPLRKQYFAVPNCNGRPLVNGQAGVIYRDVGGRLWYTPKRSSALNIRPASSMNRNDRCEEVDMGKMALRPLQPNEPEVTGVSTEAQPVSLVQR